MEPELDKECSLKSTMPSKKYRHTLSASCWLLVLLALEGDNGLKRRKIINPAFHLEKLKANFIMLIFPPENVTLIPYFFMFNFRTGKPELVPGFSA
ncbi:hypothetical protein CK203_110443 [Vitis vinifera]|uniref:Uncharacterized protein n=1 Tax=Vitis vinifera TaxID=29760 RepID=A0A438BN95_VITVI|nr:hypothetical protein CK203_110443 [Vitis vinifera]